MSVVIETTLGDITVDLYLKERPRACVNFLKLCKIKYYNYNLFHTVSRGFITQTGDPTGSRTGGESIFGVTEGPSKRYVEAEANPRIKHTKMGLISFVCNEDFMMASQFFFTLADELTYLDEKHCVFGEVVEGHDVLEQINDAICCNEERPYQDIRITHTVVLDDPLPDPPNLVVPPRSPSPSAERLQGGRIPADEEIDETTGKSAKEISEMVAEREAKARATILEMVGDIPDAEMAPPENVLFVCKLNPVTTDDDLEIIFSRFGKIKTCEVIRDHKTGDSLQYAFIEFEDKKSCEEAYFKMDNVLIDDRRIHVDFSQSVSKIRWNGKGRGVTHFDSKGKKIKNPDSREKNNRENGDSNMKKSRYRDRGGKSPEKYRQERQSNKTYRDSPSRTRRERSVSVDYKGRNSRSKIDKQHKLEERKEKRKEDKHYNSTSKRERNSSHSPDNSRKYSKNKENQTNRQSYKENSDSAHKRRRARSVSESRYDKPISRNKSKSRSRSPRHREISKTYNRLYDKQIRKHSTERSLQKKELDRKTTRKHNSRDRSPTRRHAERRSSVQKEYSRESREKNKTTKDKSYKKKKEKSRPDSSDSADMSRERHKVNCEKERSSKVKDEYDVRIHYKDSKDSAKYSKDSRKTNRKDKNKNTDLSSESDEEGSHRKHHDSAKVDSNRHVKSNKKAYNKKYKETTSSSESSSDSSDSDSEDTNKRSEKKKRKSTYDDKETGKKKKSKKHSGKRYSTTDNSDSNSDSDSESSDSEYTRKKSCKPDRRTAKNKKNCR